MLSQLGARQRTALADRTLNNRRRPVQKSGIESELLVVIRHAPLDVRRGELEHPADVCRCHEMPGWPQDMRAKDGTGVDRVFDVRVDESRMSERQCPARG